MILDQAGNTSHDLHSHWEHDEGSQEDRVQLSEVYAPIS